ncbi:hypothetical protein RAJCM14343_5285 [Rhodococcus aetherivorans]|uniref:Uncharacterized protein n=1 Tax=Rhodococcus aetherivorans TaxID=191292 RepID=A0ABQ0YUE1_9NOCA|nr:hypothetical protein RAJCM14343_5285 [Rhodococcus aetherivorans]
MRDAVGRVVEVERHVRAAGLDDAVHRNQQVDRAADRKTHRALGSDPGGNQAARHPVGGGVELRVGQGCPLELQGDGVGGTGDLLFEHADQGVSDDVADGRRVGYGHRVGEQAVDDAGQTTALRVLEQRRHEVGQHDRHQRVRTERAAHRGVERGDLAVQRCIGEDGAAMLEHDPVREGRRPLRDEPGQVLDRQRLSAGLTNRHLCIPPRCQVLRLRDQ